MIVYLVASLKQAVPGLAPRGELHICSLTIAGYIAHRVQTWKLILIGLDARITRIRISKRAPSCRLDSHWPYLLSDDMAVSALVKTRSQSRDPKRVELWQNSTTLDPHAVTHPENSVK